VFAITMRRLSFVNHTWFRMFVVGLVLFLVTEKVLRITDNPNYFPTVILLGAFLVPVTFVTFVYEREAALEIPLSVAGICFIWGGTVGVLAAGLVEYDTRRDFAFFPQLGIGFIEEAAKLIFPLVIFFGRPYRREADGLVFGAASGMGFAALETMGYGFVALVASNGNVGVLEDTLLVRGFLAPFGHGAWTAIVCAVLWRQREQRTPAPRAVLATAGAFIMAVVLHALWDTFAGLEGATLIEFLGVELLTLGLAIFSFLLFMQRMREAVRSSQSVAETS
jgi:protease PrsW